MKRFIFPLFSLLGAGLLLSGCSAPKIQTAVPDIDKSFSAEAELSYGKDSCTVQMRRFGENSWEFCVTEPFPLEGLIITVNDGETKLTMYDMESLADVSEEAVSAARLITDAFEAAIDNRENAAASEGIITLSGQAPTCTYTLTIDEKGTPTGLTIGGRGVSAEFTKFVEMEEEAEIVT
ncbi:MAG: hypothetical protein ACI4J7_08580 [Ruminiclostridium sp.]